MSLDIPILPSNKVPDHHLEDAKRDGVNLLHSNFLSSFFINLIVSAILVFYFDSVVYQYEKYVWWMCFNLLLVYRLADFSYWKFKLANTSYSISAPYYRFFSTHFLDYPSSFLSFPPFGCFCPIPLFLEKDCILH